MIVVTTQSTNTRVEIPYEYQVKSKIMLSVDKGGHMKLITPCTILNRNSHEIDFIKDAMKNRRLATERLHDDYRKIYKNHQFA